MILNVLTFVHLTFCLLAIGAGIQVMLGLFSGELIGKWAVAFFRCALTASVAKFIFPFQHLSHLQWLALSSVYVTGAAILAWRKFHLVGIWRSICALSITTVLCINVLLLSTQVMKLIPILKTPSSALYEHIFQSVIVAVFVCIGTFAALRFRNRANLSS
jgi:hypothetical protein